MDIQLSEALLSGMRVAVLRILAMISLMLSFVGGTICIASTSPVLLDVSLGGTASVDRQRAWDRMLAY